MPKKYKKLIKGKRLLRFGPANREFIYCTVKTWGQHICQGNFFQNVKVFNASSDTAFSYTASASSFTLGLLLPMELEICSVI